MEILQFNFAWMSFNVFLALIPVLFGYLMVTGRSRVAKVITGFVWFIFLPNTIYLLTDPINLFVTDSRSLSGALLIIDIFMYAILIPIGAVTYIISMAFFEKLFKKNKKKDKKLVYSLIFILNFIVAFGIVLGRFQRVNSWEVISDPVNVIEKSIGILTSPYLLCWLVIFAVVCQMVYFYFGSFERLRQRVIAA